MSLRPTSEELERFLGVEHKILDKGFIRVVDYMGTDASIVQAARVSYGDGTKTVRQDKGLISYLMRNEHTTPFEMCEIKLHIKAPMFVTRQWLRHRTASVNEYSARYSVMKEEYYTPDKDNICNQSSINKQSSGEELLWDDADEVNKIIDANNIDTYWRYEQLIEDYGVARELARVVLPNNIYTEFYWKIDLHNLLHFIRLRCDSHSQSEIRQYAFKIKDIIKSWVPYTYTAYTHHTTEEGLSG